MPTAKQVQDDIYAAALADPEVFAEAKRAVLNIMRDMNEHYWQEPRSIRQQRFGGLMDKMAKSVGQVEEAGKRNELLDEVKRMTDAFQRAVRGVDAGD